MKKVLIIPVVVAALVTAACGDDGGPTEVDTTPTVRFVNATTGMTGNGGFTANGQFATGSALAFGQSTCSKVNEGQTSFGFGAANASGTGLSGNALATLDNQIAAGGDYTLVATGPATSATLYLVGNSFSGSLGTNQAAVRFVNLAPTTGATTYNYFFYEGAVGASTPLASNMAFGLQSAYSVMTSGAKTFSVLQVPGHTEVIASSTATLPGGSVNTIALVQNNSGSFQLIILPRCS